MATEKDTKQIMEALGAKMPKESIQRTKKEETRKGYDTTGIGYQYVVNRFNDALGLEGWGFSYEIVKELEGAFKSGQPYHDITVSVRIWVHDKNNGRMCVGGHISSTYADALKGAITNAFKKTAAFWGVGKEAYEGAIDDDTSYPEQVEHRVPEKKKEAVLTGEIEESMTPIDKVTVKKLDAHGNPTTPRYTIWTKEGSYYTFSDTFANNAKSALAEGKYVNIRFVRTKWGNEIKDLVVLERHV